MGEKKFRFRYFIDKKFQTKFILNFVVLVILSCLLVIGYIIYVDSQKYSKGVLFEKVIADYYATTYIKSDLKKISSDLNKIKEIKEIQSFSPKIKSLLSSIDEYSAKIQRAENDLVKLISIRKNLLNHFSTVNPDSLYSSVRKVDLSQDEIQKIERILSKLNISLNEVIFDEVESSLQQFSEILSKTSVSNQVRNFVDKYNIYINMTISLFTTLSSTPDFINATDELILELQKQNFSIDLNLLGSLSSNLNKLKKDISRVDSYRALFNVDSIQVMEKPYNLLELYWKPIVAISLLQITLIIIFGLFFSHRIAGPVHRIKKELREISEGKLPVTHLIKLRKSDFLIDIANEINNTLQSIASRYNIK